MKRDIPTYTVIAISVLVAALRFTIPTREVTFSWPAWYEVLAHFWVGALLLETYRRNWACLVMLVVITAVEVAAALIVK